MSELLKKIAELISLEVAITKRGGTVTKGQRKEEARLIAALATTPEDVSRLLEAVEMSPEEFERLKPKRAAAPAFVADLATAVESFVYIIEQEEAKPNGGNRENVAAAREGLKALTGSKHVPTAKLYVERARGSKAEGADAR